MNNVNVIINGKQASVPAGSTILEAAESMGIFIPRLCFLKGINENSSCRLCVVEIKGLRTLNTFICIDNMYFFNVTSYTFSRTVTFTFSTSNTCISNFECK